MRTFTITTDANNGGTNCDKKQGDQETEECKEKKYQINDIIEIQDDSIFKNKENNACRSECVNNPFEKEHTFKTYKWTHVERGCKNSGKDILGKDIWGILGEAYTECKMGYVITHTNEDSDSNCFFESIHPLPVRGHNETIIGNNRRVVLKFKVPTRVYYFKSSWPSSDAKPSDFTNDDKWTDSKLGWGNNNKPQASWGLGKIIEISKKDYKVNEIFNTNDRQYNGGTFGYIPISQIPAKYV